MKNMKHLLVILALFMISQLTSVTYQLPKVLFLSSGDGDGRGTISDGLVIANEIFAKLGAVVRIENRKILHYPRKLDQFSIIIAPTTYGYHDGDRLYSLSYLSEKEMNNLKNWVKKGGTLVSDVYLGRNKLNGEDRISREGEFNQRNWVIAECFGVEMKEMNMKGYSIEGNEIWNDTIVPAFSKDEWTPVVTKFTSSDNRSIANWELDNNKFPAITVNRYFSGNAVLLGNFSIIHPAIDNGFSNSTEIADFYNYIYNLSINNAKLKIQLNVWENGAKAALCFSFNANGTKEQYERVLRFLKTQKIPATFFVNNGTSTEIIQRIQAYNSNEIASNSCRSLDFRTLNYANTMNELLASQNCYDSKIKGFRFPFFNNSFWGMTAINELEFAYDSSIGVNHIEFYRGSVYPYNIPIFNDNYYIATDVLEISPNLHDDWFYLKGLDKPNYSDKELENDISKYDSYLKSVWKRAILTNEGLMTITANPAYTGYNEKTMQVIENAVSRAREENTWLTNLSAVAERWNQFYDLHTTVIEKDKSLTINFTQKNKSTIRNLSLTVDKKPKNIEFSRKFTLRSSDNHYIITLSEVTHLDLLSFNFD